MSFDITLIPAFDDNYIFHFVTDDGLSVLVDPGDHKAAEAYLQQNDLSVNVILNTHHHHDHIGGNDFFREKYGCEIWAPELEIMRIPNIDVLLEEATTYTLGCTSFEVIYTAGHTRGHICLYFARENLIFVGDTLFSLGCGRLFEGTPEQMFTSLEKLKALPDTTQIYCAHEYTKANARFAASLFPDEKLYKDILDAKEPTVPTQLAFEKKYNPFLTAKNVEEFAKRRALKDKF